MRRFYAEIWSVGNQKTIDEIVAFEFSAQFFGKQGRNHLQEFVDFCRGAFPDLQAQPTDMVAEEDLVVTTVLWSGTYQGGPKEVFGIPDSAIGAKMTNKSIDYARIKTANWWLGGASRPAGVSPTRRGMTDDGDLTISSTKCSIKTSTHR